MTSRLPRFTNIIHDICVNDGLDIPLEHILTKQNFKKTEPILNHLTGNMVCDIEKGRKAVSPKFAEEFAIRLGYSCEQFVRLALQDELRRDGLKYEIELTTSRRAA